MHLPHVERLQPSVPPSIPVILCLCQPSVPNKLGYSVGSKGDENMLGVAIKVGLDPDPKKYVKVSDIITITVLIYLTLIYYLNYL